MCKIMRWSQNRSASCAERFRTSSLLCTYKLCDYYSPIPILSPFLFTPSLYAPILNLQDFSFTCNAVEHAYLRNHSISMYCKDKSWKAPNNGIIHTCILLPVHTSIKNTQHLPSCILIYYHGSYPLVLY